MSLSDLDTFTVQFDAWCRGCNDDINEGDSVGFIPGHKGIHCLYCMVDAIFAGHFENEDNS